MRDLLLGLRPKDFDVATNAHPEQIKKIFSNCRLIGRRFRLAHVYFKDGVVEVATFRARSAEGAGERHFTETGMLVRDNIYGSLEDDAWRRDFTVNALYYNIADGSVVDFTGGMEDLKQRFIRIIGDPVKRYHEDPVRLLRAIRLAAKLNFKIHTDSEQPIFELGGLLLNVPAARLFEEIIKLYVHGKAAESFKLLRHYGLFSVLFPHIEANLVGEKADIYQHMLSLTLLHADERVIQEKTLNPAFLFAVLLWFPLQNLIRQYQTSGIKIFPALQIAMEKVIRQQNRSMSIPRRMTMVMREIWIMQYRMEQRYAKRINSIFYHPRFRTSYDFLLLRAEAGDAVKDLSDWWTRFQAEDALRDELIRELQRGYSRRRR